MDQSSKLYSASLSRTQNMLEFSPVHAWYSMNLWEGSPVNSELAGKTFLLKQPRFIEGQRLSLSKETHFSLINTADFCSEGINDWSKLKTLAPYEFAILDCQGGVDISFDDRQQNLVMTVRNRQGHRVFLELPYRDWLESRITQILALETTNIRAIVVQHTLNGNQHRLEPVLVKDRSRWQSFDFEKASQRKLSFLRSLIKKFAASPDVERSEPSYIAKLIREFETLLLDYPYCSNERLKHISASLTDLGLTSLTGVIGKDELSATAVLRARYLLHLATQSISEWPIDNG